MTAPGAAVDDLLHLNADAGRPEAARRYLGRLREGSFRERIGA